jgi:hypothetical protein
MFKTCYRIKDGIRVLGFHGSSPQITFAHRISQMVNLAAEKITGERLNRALRREFKIYKGAPPNRLKPVRIPGPPAPLSRRAGFAE